MENYFWLGLVGAFIALLFAWTQTRRVKRYSEGTPLMEKIAAAIRKGANAYLKRQYKTVALIFLIIAIILAVLAYVPWINGEGLVNKFVPFAFLTGGFYSSLAGFIGMRIATSANARTANAANASLRRPAASTSVLVACTASFLYFMAPRLPLKHSQLFNSRITDAPRFLHSETGDVVAVFLTHRIQCRFRTTQTFCVGLHLRRFCLNRRMPFGFVFFQQIIQ